MVSAPGSAYMSAALTEAKTAHTGSSQVSRAEAVSDIPHRLDVLLRELAAQPPHVDVDDVAARVEAETPDVGEELVAGADLVRPPHEMPQEQELPLRQRRSPSRDVQHAPLQVQLHRADPEPPRGCGQRRMLCEAGVDPGKQLGDRKRLREVVDRSPTKAVHLRVDVTDGGQHEHSQPAVVRQEAVEDGETVDARYEQVQHHEI